MARQENTGILVFALPDYKLKQKLLERNVCEVILDCGIDGCLSSKSWKVTFYVAEVDRMPHLVFPQFVQERNPTLFGLEAVEAVIIHSLF